MRCQKCGADNAAGSRFCNQCAAQFAPRCLKCGFENALDARFCAQCASPISSTAKATPAPIPAEKPEYTAQLDSEQRAGEVIEGERKTVTALFADIKGSMDLMEDLDPEEACSIIDPALRLMIDAVHRYDGHIVQSTGDGIFALFGAPTAHEDHPQRALYAALRLQEDLKRYSDRLRERGKLPLQARVGVNTGEVVVRSIQTEGGHAEYTPIGHSTGLAARMQTLAPVGSIAATETTRKLCEGFSPSSRWAPPSSRALANPLPFTN
jgi:class 3 adenylate cyclase